MQFHNRQNRPCTLAVGGGKVAFRKVKWLLESAAQVEAISPVFDQEFETQARVSRKTLSLKQQIYDSRNLSNYALVIAATDDAQVNRQVAEDARRSRTPVNVVDAPELCTFFVPATVRRGGLQIAIATGGGSPALAARIRRELEEAYPSDYAGYSRALGRLRPQLREECGGEKAALGRILEQLASRETLESVRGMSEDEMLASMQELAQRLLAEENREE